jgi:uncharacterized protein YwqG
MTATHEAVEQVARQHLPIGVAEKWIRLLRPAARLKPRDSGDSIVGQLGGVPTLQDDVAWPEWKHHGPLAFIASVDCRELTALGLDIALPRDGTLAFFYFDGEYDDGKSSVIFEEPESLAGSRVLYVPADATAKARSSPGGITAYPRVDLSAKAVATYPNFEHPSLIDAFRVAGEDLRSFLDHPVNDLGFIEALGELDTGPAHQVGGYARPVQGPVEYEVALATLGGKTAREHPSLSRAARAWTLLVQIDSDDDAKMMWGDVGTLYWMMRPGDLMARSFDAASFTWQCS